MVEIRTVQTSETDFFLSDGSAPYFRTKNLSTGLFARSEQKVACYSGAGDKLVRG